MALLTSVEYLEEKANADDITVLVQATILSI
jgi:hypothetical protein